MNFCEIDQGHPIPRSLEIVVQDDDNYNYNY